MRDHHPRSTWRPVAAGLAALFLAAGSAWGQQGTSTSSAGNHSKDAGPVVRTFGSQGGYRTEVTSHSLRNLSEEDQRQVSLLVAQVLQHIEKARGAVDAEETKEALKDVNKGLEAIKTIRAMLPKATVRTRTTGARRQGDLRGRGGGPGDPHPPLRGDAAHPDVGPHPCGPANALEFAGVHVVQSETIATEVMADLDRIEGQLNRAAKALENNKTADAAKALALALIRGIDIRYSKDDTPLTAARDAIWLARRSLEENNAAQALANLAIARQRLMVYREVLPQDQRQEVDQMLQEVEQLEGQLRQEGTQTVSNADRARQGNTVTHWWNRINSWFRRHL